MCGRALFVQSGHIHNTTLNTTSGIVLPSPVVLAECSSNDRNLLNVREMIYRLGKDTAKISSEETEKAKKGKR